jgi:hypothetical protein
MRAAGGAGPSDDAKSIIEIDGKVSNDDSEGRRVALMVAKRYGLKTGIGEMLTPLLPCASATTVRCDDYLGFVYRRLHESKEFPTRKMLDGVQEGVLAYVRESGAPNASAFFANVEIDWLTVINHASRRPIVQVAVVTPFHHLCHVLSHGQAVMKEQKAAIAAAESAARV